MLIVGMFMSALDTSIVNVAIPHIQTELGASARDVEWVVTDRRAALRQDRATLAGGDRA
ncbi:hypothetical protein ACTXG6_44015 [Pseudonocardia sp. Cha107L01]|uniref:hypothetical protein n=1 Tax=Pseudonocardia sp. Cha107L01 TaxID=3457576 RepID=UPI00403EF205